MPSQIGSRQLAIGRPTRYRVVTDFIPRQKTANLFVGEAFVLPYSKTAVFILFLEITHPAPNVAYAIGIIPVAPS